MDERPKKPRPMERRFLILGSQELRRGLVLLAIWWIGEQLPRPAELLFDDALGDGALGAVLGLVQFFAIIMIPLGIVLLIVGAVWWLMARGWQLLRSGMS